MSLDYFTFRPREVLRGFTNRTRQILGLNNMRFLCNECTQPGRIIDFPTLKDLSVHIKGGHANLPEDFVEPEAGEDRPKTATSLERPKPKPPEPPKLVYKYVGNCDCGRELETIEVKLGEKDMQIAYCSSCKKQLMQQDVVPIERKKNA